MSERTDVSRAEDFAPGTCRNVDIDGVAVAVFNVGGNDYAIDALCSHEAEPLCGGDMEGQEVVCPRDRSHFFL